MRSRLSVLLLVPALVMAGCSGGSDVGSPTDVDPADPGTLDPSPTPTPTRNPMDATGCSSDDPQFHTHDYWGIRESFTLYDGRLAIGQAPASETLVTQDHVIVGFRVFDTHTDGDDRGSTDKTDIVYQGTRAIVLTLTWDQPTIPGLQFYFKHASTPEFSLLGPVVSGQQYQIPLQPRWADMAHQDFVSRWAFKIEAYDPAQSASPLPVHVARGEVLVEMDILRGDPSQIDPPHPAFFCTSDLRYAGEINRTVVPSVVVTAEGSKVRYPAPLDEWAPEAPHIVPFGTTLLRAWLHYNYTGPAAADMREFGLKYHGADTVEYSYPEPGQKAAGYAYYEIPVTGLMTDSPYAFQTDWRYGVYPIINGQAENGDFQGDIHIRLQAVKQ